MIIDGPRTRDAQSWLRWELLAWVLLLGVAAFLRFYDLGARVMSHDESIHAFYGYELLRQGTYTHDPTYHGPLLYHLNALVFYFLGASDATARLSSALAGIALVASMWLFRPFLGRTAALCVATLVALSPALLFYSRQVWMDVHVTLFSMLWIYGVFRYLSDRSRRWLYLVTGAMVLAFVTKEVAFIFGAIIGAWVVVELIATWRVDKARAVAAGDLAVLMFALVAPFSSGAGFLALGWNVRDQSARGLWVVGALVAIGGVVVWLWVRMRRRLLGAPVDAPAPLASDDAPAPLATDDALSPLAPPGPVAGQSPADAGLRVKDWAVLMTLFWSVAILLFTAFFTNLRGGLSSGIVGSLGYWLTQHEVARGSQPWFYYFLLSALYDLLPLVCGGIALVLGAARLRHSWWDPAAGDLPPEPASPAEAPPVPSIGRGDRRSFLSFVLWWTLAAWCAYTYAGEKMPWLLTHLVLPLAIVAGWGLARLVLAVLAGPRVGWGRALLLFGGGVVLPVLVVEWAAGHPFSGETTQAVADTMKWVVRAAVIAALLAFMARAAWRAGGRQTVRLVALGVAGLLFVLTVRSGLRLCFRTYDLATEHLSYAQGAPDVKRAMREIELISERSAGDRELFVAYDDQSSWPFVWYLRDYPKSRTWGTQPNFAKGAAVIITGPKNRDGAWPLVASGYVKREYRLIWWPRQEYAEMGPREIWALLHDPDRRGKLWQMAMNRDYTHIDAVKWDPRQDFDMYVREDVAPLGLMALGIGDVGGGGGSAPTAPGASSASVQLKPEPRLILAGPYDGATLAMPTDIAIAPDGARVVTDAGNHRVLVLERDGTLRRAFGSRCDIAQAETSGCTDPDGPGPLAIGDGQFNEPWGVAVGPNGDIFVADTWNHRVQHFDSNGRFLGKWGRYDNAPVTGETAGSEPFFYGPRGISIGLDDDLLVTDTGNKRVQRFSLQGEYRGALGSGGVAADEWNEPVGIAPDSNGTLLVADTWNQRVKRLDRRYAPIGTWRVPDWRSESVTDKPFLAVDDGGTVFAGDPAGGRVWMFEPSGRLKGTLVLPALPSGTPRPLGIAIDRETSELLVIDHAGGRLLVFPLPAIETRQLQS